jgi:hypothetical protein
MIRSMLLECQGILSDGDAIREQSNCLLQGIQAKVYQPLFQRPTCSKCCVATGPDTYLFLCAVMINEIAKLRQCLFIYFVVYLTVLINE